MKTFIIFLSLFSVNTAVFASTYECKYVDKVEKCKYYPDVKDTYAFAADSDSEARATCKLGTNDQHICSLTRVEDTLNYTPGTQRTVSNKNFLENRIFHEKQGAQRILHFIPDSKGTRAIPMNLTGYTWGPFSLGQKYGVFVDINHSLVTISLSSTSCKYFIQNNDELIAQKYNHRECPRDLEFDKKLSPYATDIHGTWKSESCTTCTVKLSDTNLPDKNGEAQFSADYLHWGAQGQVKALNVNVHARAENFYLFSTQNFKCYYFRYSEKKLIYIHSISNGKCARDLTLATTPRLATLKPKPKPKLEPKPEYQSTPSTPTTTPSTPKTNPYAIWLTPEPKVAEIPSISELEKAKIENVLLGNWAPFNSSERLSIRSSLLGLTVDGPSWIRGSAIAVSSRDGTVEIDIGGHTCRYILNKNDLNAQKDNSSICPTGFRKE